MSTFVKWNTDPHTWHIEFVPWYTYFMSVSHMQGSVWIWLSTLADKLILKCTANTPKLFDGLRIQIWVFECFHVCPLFFWHFRNFPSCYTLICFYSVPWKNNGQTQLSEKVKHNCTCLKSKDVASSGKQELWRNTVSQSGWTVSVMFSHFGFCLLLLWSTIWKHLFRFVETGSWNQLCKCSSGITARFTIIVLHIKMHFNSTVILSGLSSYYTYNCESVFSCMCN